MSLRTSLSFALVFAAGIACGLLAGPVKRTILAAAFQQRYGELVYACDGAMRSHLHAKFALEDAPRAGNVANLEAAEIGLLVCQDYDLFQKKLMRYGLEEEDLGFMRLKAVEEKGRDLQLVVQEHEFRY